MFYIFNFLIVLWHCLEWLPSLRGQIKRAAKFSKGSCRDVGIHNRSGGFYLGCNVLRPSPRTGV